MGLVGTSSIHHPFHLTQPVYPSIDIRAMVGGLGGFTKEAIDLEAQLHSQFHSLRRVFQAHSKAEDDLIWPALREKAWRDGVARESLECALEEDHSDEECASCLLTLSRLWA